MVAEKETKICIIGLGHVGLPLAIEFAKEGSMEVFGFDINEKRTQELKNNIESINEISSEDLEKTKIIYSSDPEIIRKANFLIVAVPTPIDRSKKPDLAFIKGASKIIGENIQKNSIVVFESTVFPGATEEVCVPIIEEYSQLKCGNDWYIGYSPERINPGDKEHTIDKIVKIVSGADKDTLDKISQVYSAVCKAGVYKAENIKTAEAAKVIENVQRDLNIALVNELSLIFHRLGINTKDVIEAAATKWNFHKYLPGLVGGHCIGVDPYYLTHRAEELGYHPQIILAGRHINDYMPEYVAELMIKGLIQAGKIVQNSKVLIMGLTFKENVKDTRNSKARDIISKLKEYQIDVYGYDPLLSEKEAKDFNVKYIASAKDLPKIDGIVLCVFHNEFTKLTLDKIQGIMNNNPVLVDVKSYFSDQSPQDKGFIYKRL